MWAEIFGDVVDSLFEYISHCSISFGTLLAVFLETRNFCGRGWTLFWSSWMGNGKYGTCMCARVVRIAMAAWLPG